MNYGIHLKVSGDYALFSRPEMKVERVSYDIMTPSAARGLLEAIYWKPQIRWIIDEIHVLNPIRFTNIRRNEISLKIAVKGGRGVNAAMGNPKIHPSMDVSENRRSGNFVLPSPRPHPVLIKPLFTLCVKFFRPGTVFVPPPVALSPHEPRFRFFLPAHRASAYPFVRSRVPPMNFYAHSLENEGPDNGEPLLTVLGEGEDQWQIPDRKPNCPFKHH